ncbi:phage tail tape measure protein [Serratia symbiotica]|uniref:phage tail tape measure protein n=1 Tax=Serratia symbiotica TaxID=138074 RepID=UPI003463AFFE
MGNARKLAFISQIFGTESTSVLAELLDKQASLDPSQRIEAYAEQVKDSLGTAGKVAKTMADNMKGDLQNLDSAWEDLGIEMFESVDSPLRDITRRITGMLQSVGQWMKDNPKLTATLVKIGAAVGAFSVALGGITLTLAALLGPMAALKLSLSVLGIKGGSALGLLANAFKRVGKAVVWLGRAMMANPILAVIALIAGAAIWIWSNWEWLGPKFAALWNGITTTVSGVWEGIKTTISNALAAIVNFFTNWNLFTVFTAVWDNVISSVSGLPAMFMAIGSNIMDGLKQGIDAKWEAIKNRIMEMADCLPNGLKDKLGIHSPSQVFAEMGRYTVDGLAVGIADNTQTALASVGQLAKRLTAAGAGLTLSAAAVAMPLIAAIPDNRVPLSPSSVAAPATSSGPITIHIHAAPGMNEQQLAKLVAQELDRRERQNAARRRSSLRDID